jgi:two-component system chemotaxis sensor kinase CheA
LNKPGSDISQELLDDFFTEADEHLINIRRALHRAEMAGSEGPDAGIMVELFHHFHSFKGISAIVGLVPAEGLAHAGEDLLRSMRDGQVQAGKKELNVLNAIAHKLEQIVAAFRAKEPTPPHQTLLAEINSAYPNSSSFDTAFTQTRSNDFTSSKDFKKTDLLGLSLWKYTFTPTPQLNARNINVNTIREQFSQVGQILKSTPVVKGKGLITFEFLIAKEQAPTDAQEWEAKGVTIELVTEQQARDSISSNTNESMEGSSHSPFLAPSHIVRVDLKRLDDLLRIVGEMVIHRSRLEIQLAQLSANGKHLDLRGVEEVNRMLGRSLRQMREDIMRIRLIPISEIFIRLPFVIRDLSRETSKKVRLKLLGQETAIDKYLIEKLKDPLLHMVRNAFSHGIETVAERKARSKPEEATIELNASAAGEFVIIKVRDDGKGINVDAILQRAKHMGLKIPHTVDSEAILHILCSPGFSTRDSADRTSGRGVGMSVVHSTVNELGGKLTLESNEGQGTQFTLRLPLSVVIAETFLVSAAGQTCAVPQNSVREIFHATEAEIKVADGIEMISYREGVLPITRLSKLFHLKDHDAGVRCILVITSERGSVGLLVERVLGQREVVVRNFRDPLIQVAGVSGATELGDGKPVLILDGMALTAGNVRPDEN